MQLPAVYCFNVQFFGAKSLLGQFANDSNERLRSELERLREREKATREILEVIRESRADEMPVLDAIVRNAAHLCGADLVGLSLVNDARTKLRYTAIHGPENEFFLPGYEFDLSSPIQVVQTVNEARTIHTKDLADDTLYWERNPIRVMVVEELRIRTFLTVPLTKEGVAFGCLNLTRSEVRPFADDDITLIEAFAEQATIAIENVRQFRALEARTEEVQKLNSGLESRVEAQVGEIERMGRLKRFLSPQVVDAVLSSGNEELLSSHRALLGILFCDIRGFTTFCETAEPEESIEVLQTYHEAMGVLIAEHGAGVDTRAGDGIMVLFNDPLPCDDPAGDALRLGLAMRSRMEELCSTWRRHGHKLGFGVGISLGYATVGMVGAAGRTDYTASGTAVNLAARLCDEAADGEILLSPRAYAATAEEFVAEAIGEISLKGIHAPVEVYRVSDGN